MTPSEEVQHIIRRVLVPRMVQTITNETPLVRYLRAGLPKPKPLTRWESFRARLDDYRERIVTAWRVLRGDDIHEDCAP